MRRLFIVVALALVAFALIVLSSCGGTAEPAAGKTFTQAIHAGNNVAARAVETQACLESYDNNFCLDATYDAKVKDLAKSSPISFVFIGAYINAQGDIVAVYRASFISPSSHKLVTDTLVVTVEKKTGKISYANLTSDAGAA